MRWIPLILLAVPLSSQAPTKVPTPFGITPGMALERIQSMDAKLHPRGGWLVAKPPRPHPKLTQVIVFATKAAGACGVVAYTLPTTTYYDALSVLNFTQLDLLVLYGVPDSKPVNSMLRPDEVADPTALDVVWNRSVNKKLPAGLTSITLRPVHIDGSYSAMIQYKFANWDKCQRADSDPSGSLGD